ncbi:hypothetical protein TIFTF001_018431 [Ficus carica]|uniref:Uncharacterized protein n=1 Tax=Ficus carica TaxID=3494 RepID=A0AA88DJ80_FICCA|nr:hypothetical protein TIFTF001_018431 [Ficus carica]
MTSKRAFDNGEKERRSLSFLALDFQPDKSISRYMESHLVVVVVVVVEYKIRGFGWVFALFGWRSSRLRPSDLSTSELRGGLTIRMMIG